MSPRRASQPPPLPPLRARPSTSHRVRSGRDRPACSLPPPAPGGGINTISKPSKPSTPAPPSSQPPPLPPLRARPSAPPPLSLRDVSVQTARCPLPLPAGAFNHINSYLSTQLLCVRPSLIRTIFFFLCSVIHLGPCLASLRPGPRRAPSQRF